MTKSKFSTQRVAVKNIFSTYVVGTNSDSMLQTVQERCL